MYSTAGTNLRHCGRPTLASSICLLFLVPLFLTLFRWWSIRRWRWSPKFEIALNILISNRINYELIRILIKTPEAGFEPGSSASKCNGQISRLTYPLHHGASVPFLCLFLVFYHQFCFCNLLPISSIVTTRVLFLCFTIFSLFWLFRYCIFVHLLEWQPCHSSAEGFGIYTNDHTIEL